MRPRALATLLVIGPLAAAPAGALAGPDPENLPWPELLPPAPVPTSVQPHPVPHCRNAGIHCMDALLHRLRRQWRALDPRCDHRALFSLAYLRITKGLRDDLARPHPRFFRYRRWMIAVIVDFSNRYFATFRDYARGRPVPESWRIAYDEDMHGDTSGGQDVLLASNAHTQHDLPYIYADMGMRTRHGASRKPDHDRVNEVLDRAYQPVVNAVAERYDPLLFTTNASWDPLDDIGGLEMVKGWREGVWRNAERLVNARSAAERQQVADQIHQNAALWAEAMAAPQTPGYRAQRDAYCAGRM